MTFADVLDFAHVAWSEQFMDGPRGLDQHLDNCSRPPDEGAEAQARLDAMLSQ